MQPKPRTSSQNKALHKFCDDVAMILINHGITMKIFMKDFEVEHTGESVKSVVKAIGKQKYNLKSTSEYSTTQLSETCEELIRHLAKMGIDVNFPSAEWRDMLTRYSS